MYYDKNLLLSESSGQLSCIVDTYCLILSPLLPSPFSKLSVL